MSSYFNLELDTTPPELTISLPTYTIIGIDNEIRIVSNDELSNFQNIYFIDAYGERHNVIFDMVSKYELVGYVSFKSFPTGISQLNVKLKDEVFNESALYQETINIMLGADVNIDLIKNTRNISSVGRTRAINSRFEIRRILNKVYTRNMDLGGNSRKIESEFITHISGRG